MNPKSDSPQEPFAQLPSRTGRSWYRSKRFIIVFSALVAVIISGAVWYFFLQPKKAPVTLEDKATYELIEASKKQGPHDSLQGKISFYTILGDDYRDVEEYESALEAYLEADKLITDRSLTTGQSVNLSLADTYEQLGKRSDAVSVLRKELSRIQQDPTYDAEPDNKKVAQIIETRIKELE